MVRSSIVVVCLHNNITKHLGTLSVLTPSYTERKLSPETLQVPQMCASPGDGQVRDPSFPWQTLAAPEAREGPVSPYSEVTRHLFPLPTTFV